MIVHCRYCSAVKLTPGKRNQHALGVCSSPLCQEKHKAACDADFKAKTEGPK